jgi:predicted glutamine amidotransferase
MSRLFGLVINDPQRVACALHPARDSLVARGAPEGWGLACFQGGEVLLQRHPKPLTGPLDFYKAAKDLRTDYIVGHVADPGTVAKLESTQPYRFRSWVYAQSGGSTPRLLEPGAGILEHVPDFLRRNIRAHTPAEHLFHALLAFLHDAGKLDDVNIRVGDAVGALRGAMALAQRLADGEAEGRLPMNVITTNGRILLAARGGKPMWIRQVSGILDCRVCGEALPEHERRDRRRTSHEHVRAVIIASEPDSVAAEGWEEVPEDSIVGVTRELQKSILPLRTEA